MTREKFQHDQQQRRERITELSQQTEQLTKDAEKPTPYWQAMIDGMSFLIDYINETWNSNLRQQPEAIDLSDIKSQTRQLRSILDHGTIRRANSKLNSLSGQIRTLKIQIAGGRFSRWVVAQSRKVQRFAGFLWRGIFR